MKPKFYLNGFPKSGLHLLVSMMSVLAQPQPPTPFNGNHWIGTFTGDSWGGDWLNLKYTFYRLSEVRNGYYLKGHSGYRQDLVDFIRNCGIAHIFIYRDLRDVAVSQAFHILSDDDINFNHPARHLYSRDFDKTLEQVIVGIAGCPGVVERWQKYKNWLDEDWVLCLKFSEILADKKAAAQKILDYSYARLMEYCPYGWEVEGMEAVAGAMAAVGTEKSPNFRQGIAGEWREYFTNKHHELYEMELNKWA